MGENLFCVPSRFWFVARFPLEDLKKLEIAALTRPPSVAVMPGLRLFIFWLFYIHKHAFGVCEALSRKCCFWEKFIRGIVVRDLTVAPGLSPEINIGRIALL